MHGTLNYAAEAEAFGCFMEDVSLGGAKLCPADLFCGATCSNFRFRSLICRPCSRVWASEDFYGVAFCVEATAAAILGTAI